MRKTLAPSLTQQWLTIGLNKWHQSIARREASRVGLQAKGLVIQWTSIEKDKDSISTNLFTCDPSHSARLPSSEKDEFETHDEPQVVLIDRLKVEIELKNRKSIHQTAQRIFCHDCSLPPVFLLWDWGPSGRSSLEWATVLGFAGVVFNFSTLRHWTMVAVNRLPTKLKELHPLVATRPTYQSVQRQN